MYIWCLVFKDGNKEYQNATVPEKNLNNLDISNLFRLELIPIGDVPPIIITWAPGRKLIYKRRFYGKMTTAGDGDQIVSINSSGTTENELEILTIGWSEIIEDNELTYLLHIYPNGSIEISDGEPAFVDDFVKLYLGN